MPFVALIIIVVLLLAGCGPTKRCLVSPLSGTVVAHGKPVAGAKVTRKYYSDWYKDQVETVIRTDTNGFFEFQGAWKTALVNILHQPVIQEEVVVEYDGTNYPAWNVTKMDYELLGELSDTQLRTLNGDMDRFGKQGGKLYLRIDVDLKKARAGEKQ